ncbi:family 65 glycosyl hydrolase domain-containing protein [Aquirufa ecclesiirivi]|uniref:family 65 glycosyl hydrolase domain-containing protein n=1 Tax=Aquirufa ecclesiirivi TaxID=2715124 RepID=UPI0023D7F157|nr:family 65 glycosyl hydrolase domain-containing protein [Aquirufa ecclesiirivi]MDF0693768.1 family 65 glycosyl hydrolase domain-containing protein [Aquirufa ecclesiirivi]
MKQYLKHDAWKVIEDSFHPEFNEITESIFSLGNGRMGQRANFEESYTGKTLQGNYVAGVYYPDKTRVGWWKNGYPEYFAKVLNAANWIGIDIEIEGVKVDLHQASIHEFYRELNMKEGYLLRTCEITLSNNKRLKIKSIRFNSMADDESGAISYSITPVNFSGSIQLKAYIDGDIQNKDSNYQEKFWDQVKVEAQGNRSFVWSKTKKTHFEVITGQEVHIYQNGQKVHVQAQSETREKYSALSYQVDVIENEPITLFKYAINLSSENHPTTDFEIALSQYLTKIASKGFDQMLQEQALAWAEKWNSNDIVIEGDVAAQQGIRFNIFQLNQTYTGKDDRLNIGPKGFTGEKYGGSTYWDTEAYCIPFYLSTAPSQVAKNLLIYRWKQLDKAIENAQKLGFDQGAALYPMVTMNGEECHNEWEITFEEIHRNGAIAYAIKDYVQYTDDKRHLLDYGWDVLLAIARFWKQRVNWSENLQKYVMLGVTGPNEYENNVNNNWYTNYLAAWCLSYVQEVHQEITQLYPNETSIKLEKSQFKVEELVEFEHIVQHMHYPRDEKRGIYLQQDGFLDKIIAPVDQIPAQQRPINQHWSWDRILRSCYIKQADVLQGMYFFESDFSLDEIERNYSFYEPLTVHESSLSPCVHSILAAKLGKEDKSYEFYTRAARLDLDDYNNDTEDGCHITSMAGSWMSIIKGFAGQSVQNNQLHLAPFLPKQWKSYRFKINFRNDHLEIEVNQAGVKVQNLAGHASEIVIHDKKLHVAANSIVVI